ncbi:MAG: alpha/beta hydrolase, partial [Frankiales bacterium]|nr:alpha/beta hydrolase [Frankiales bacterium]
LDTADALCRGLAAEAGFVVVSVGYRLAPEHRFPAPVDDTLAALAWVVASATNLGVDPTALVLAGESAGANITAGACLAARDRGGPAIAAQWLDVPAVDLTFPPTPSYLEFGTGFGLDVDGVEHIVNWYLTGDDRKHPYASPAGSADLSGLPPAVITVAGCDPMRDQGSLYAARLRAAGADVREHCVDGALHGTTWLTGLLPAARECRAFVVESLRELIASRRIDVADAKHELDVERTA